MLLWDKFGKTPVPNRESEQSAPESVRLSVITIADQSGAAFST